MKREVIGIRKALNMIDRGWEMTDQNYWNEEVTLRGPNGETKKVTVNGLHRYAERQQREAH